jgi:hypothetical protein
MLQLQGVAERVLVMQPGDADGDVSGDEAKLRLRGLDMMWRTWKLLAPAGGAGLLLYTWASAGVAACSLTTGRPRLRRQASENTSSLPS